MMTPAPSLKRDYLMGGSLLVCLLTISILGGLCWLEPPKDGNLVLNVVGIQERISLIILGGYFGAMIAAPPPSGTTVHLPPPDASGGSGSTSTATVQVGAAG